MASAVDSRSRNARASAFMRQILPLLLLLLLLCSSPIGAAQLPLASIRYFNPYQDPTNWGGWGSAIYQGNGASVRNVGGTVPIDIVGGSPALVLDSVNPPGAWWNVLFKVSGNPLNWLRTGSNPAIHLRLAWTAIPTNQAWNMNLQVGTGQVPLNAYLNASTTGWQDIYIPASDLLAGSPGLDLTHVWQVALFAAGNYLDHCILDIAAIDLVPSASPAQRSYAEFAKVDQLGYAPLMSDKFAVISWETNAIAAPPTWFQIFNATNSQLVLTGAVTRFIQPAEWQAPGWTLDGDAVYRASFGQLQAPGTYRLELPELGARSQNFSIGTNIYQDLFRDVLRFCYYSRSSVPILEPFGEGFDRDALHADNTNASYNYSSAYGHFHYGTNLTRDAHGGWFDAGDTHIDVPNTAIACWFLTETMRDFGRAVPSFSLDLPESNSQQGDLVPLISWGLDWLKRMQNADGSVNHYLMGAGDAVTATQQVSDISSFATASAAAAFAKAYSVFSNSLPADQSADFLARARLAWSWLQLNTNMVQPRLPMTNGVDPGADDPSWGDATFDNRCRAFAAVELFEATGESQFNSFFVAQFNANGGSPLSGPVFGSNTTGYGSDSVLTYLNHPLNFAFMDYARSGRSVDAGIQAALKSAFLHQADVLTNYTGLSGYSIPMLYPGHLYWGSSGGVLAPSAFVLWRAFEWSAKTEYVRTAQQALHFILGRNPVNRIFVSGYGDYQHGSDFYSHFWTNLLQQPPGYLGGNIDVDGSAQMVVEFPWKRFINTQDADMTEPGVYWNSAFAWLSGWAAEDSMPPSLAIKPASGGVNVAWPLQSALYTLSRSTNLAAGAGWIDTTNSPASSNGLWGVFLPSSPSRSEFYRLRPQ